jgi:hypothetical protein
LAVVTAILSAGAMIVVGATSASAGPLPIPQTTNVSVSTAGGWHAKCAFSVKSVNHNTFVATGHIGAVATAKSNSAFANNIFTEVICNVFDSNSNFIDGATFTSNGPTLPQQRKLVQEPYSPFYGVCIIAYVKLHDGSDSGPFGNCVNVDGG